MDTRTKTTIKNLISENKLVNKNGCWIWQGNVNRDGYGSLHFTHKAPCVVRFCESLGNKSRIASHRLAYFAWHGDLPKDKPLVTHTCNNKLCCNPDHLQAGTPLSNAQDQIDSGSRTHVAKYRKRPLAVREEIRQMIRDGYSHYKIARIFNTSVINITRYKRVMEKNNE